MIKPIKVLRLLSPWRAYAKRSSSPKPSRRKPKKPELGTMYSKLHNGLTVATETRLQTPYVCMGLYIDAGSRYEQHNENGIAHFFEHIVFKRTKNRNTTELKKTMMLTGANFRCFTTREMVCYYVQCLHDKVPLAVDLLCDCVFNNLLSNNDTCDAKTNVYHEMIKCDEDINTLMYDYLHKSAFQNTPLAQTVIGPSYNLNSYSPSMLQNYLKKFFSARRTVLAAVGNIGHEQFLDLARDKLNCLNACSVIETAPYRYTGSDVRYRDDSMPMANVIIAVEGPSWYHKDNVVMEIARCAVGGWDRSQVSGDSLPGGVAQTASKQRLCDAYKAFNINYKDTGLWGVQFISDVQSLDYMSNLVQGEWMYLCSTITETEVDRAKEFHKTKLLTKMQSATAACHDLGRWILYKGCQPTLAEKIKAIDHVQVADFQEICTKYLYDRCPTVVAIGRVEGLMEYQRIRSAMYWLRY